MNTPAATPEDSASDAPAVTPADTALCPPASPDALADWLRAHGHADARTPAAHGNTPLMQAAWRGERAIVEALLRQQPPPALDAVNGDGNNALWLACVSRDVALVQRLVRAGVPLDHRNLTGATALMYAASSGRDEVVAALLALGANPWLTTQDDFSALDMAATLASLQALRQATRTGQPPQAARAAEVAEAAETAERVGYVGSVGSAEPTQPAQTVGAPQLPGGDPGAP